MIKLDFPALEYMRFDGEMTTNSWWVPESSKVAVIFNKFDINAHVSLKVNDKGYLRPICYGANVKWGDSFFYHDNWWVQ